MRNGLNSPCNNYCINKTALKYNQSLDFLHKFSNKDPWLGGPQDPPPPRLEIHQNARDSAYSCTHGEDLSQQCNKHTHPFSQGKNTHR